jgi:hypothetical protein
MTVTSLVFINYTIINFYMNLYTSYGTYGFLNQIQLNNPDHNLYQYSASDTSEYN